MAASSAAASARSAELGGGAGPVELRAAQLEPEVRDDRLRPLGGGNRDAGVERIGGVDRTVELGTKLVEPLLRPPPLAVDAHRGVDEGLAALERLEAGEVGVPRRARVEDDAAADGRAGAQDDPVATRGDDRPRQAELREPVAGAGDASGGLRRAVVEHDARRDLAQRLERDVEPEARPERSRRDEDVAAPQLLPLDAGERDGDALSRLGALDRPVVHLHAPHAHGAAARLETQLVALADRPRPERPGRDRPDPAEREGAVDMEPGRPAGVVLCRPGCDLRQRGAQLVEAGAGAGARCDDGSAGDELLRLGARELERLLVDGVGLRQRDHAVLDPEQAQDRQVLVRLRPRSLPGVDHEQEEVDAARARDHRADEALVPGHVDDREARAVRQLERGIAEVDRDPALVLLRQPVGVLARQRLDERRLAVVDVTRGTDRQRH